MQAPGDGESAADPSSETGQNWLGNSVWRVPDLEISKIYSWPSMTVMSCHSGGGQTLWRGDRHHRLAFALMVDGPSNWQAIPLISRMVAAIAKY